MPKRLDPDEILSQIVKLSCGRHKIYLGMAPGVGKTYKMLEEALELKKKGVDIAIGYIEMQNRVENQALINSFEMIPRKCFNINNNKFYDLDLEAIIEKKHATVIIDELAHTNMPGSLNQKRYEDIAEILKHGISVLSTLNIHQIESITPIVEKNLGIKINETVPDWVVNQADELVLVDITIDELYKRLETKQIYNQEQLKHAYKNFFKKNNLYLLRDLALNLLSERIDVEFASEESKAKIKDRILVASSPKESSLRLIKHASEIALTTNAGIDVLCILKEKDENKEQIINKLREETRLHKGNFFLLRHLNKSISEELIHFVKLNRITLVIMGYSQKPRWKDLMFGSNVFNLLRVTSNIDVLIVGKKEGEAENKNIKTQQETETTIKKPHNQNFGRLKIYIGMAPGVGKTYRMLQDARELHKNGADVLLGVIETHGRAETAHLMEGLSILPPRLIEHKDKLLPEFDLEAAILRKPEYILIDELAHTNVSGSVNNKRYQDVQYLLRAGINVLSTVNIQHIESLNDLVEQVTGIKVRETLPDWVMSHANEIILIDISPQALQERLKAGKIYSVDKIEQALTHFFQRKNLMALRELSLREVAETVEHEMYPKAQRAKIVSFVDLNDDTLRLIRKSARIASRSQAELIVIHITKNTAKLTERKKLSIIDLEQLVVELGGDFRLLEGNNIVNEMSAIQKKLLPDYIVIGEPTRNHYASWFSESIARTLLNKTPESHIWIVGDFTI